jgi:hypothetical protein
MYRASTPTFTFELPFTLSGVQECLITFSQDEKTVVEKSLADTTHSGSTIKLTLTQEDTLEFEVGKASVQLNVMTKTGQRLPSVTQTFKVLDNLHDEVIEVE